MFKKIISLFLALCCILVVTGCSSGSSYEGKTVILHSNDVHGSIEGYAYMSALKKDFERKGADVIVVDGGDFSAGSLYLSETEGKIAIEMMNEVGYDVAGIGNHDFQLGYEKLLDNLAYAEFKPICANVFNGENSIFDLNTVIERNGVKIGFFGILTPETQTKVTPTKVKGLTFTSKQDMYDIAKKQVEELKPNCDIVICISHLGVDVDSTGNRSTDLYANAEGIDFIIDGHSHTVMEKGENGEPIQSTGTAFENIGVIEINNKTKKIERNYLLETANLEKDVKLSNLAQNLMRSIDYKYTQIFATVEVDLDGKKETNRSSETNMGDLITDAMKWYVEDMSTCKVSSDHIVCMLNSGSIRASINKGEVSKADIHNVLPFDNTLTLNYVKGSYIREILEASTYCSPEIIGGFPQVSGIEYTIDTVKAYDKGEQYPNSTYYGPKTINRVTIDNINGKTFNEEDIYAVISNDFCSEGGDTFYALKRAKDEGKEFFDTGICLHDVVIKYVTEELSGIIGTEYSLPQGRIHIIKPQD